MSKLLCCTIRFLDPEPTFHGRRDGGEPEWPPSPLRLFQALVDAAASRWRIAMFAGFSKPALEWLQQLDPPVVVAPKHHVGVPFRIAVPNNDLDVWAGPVSKGTNPKKEPNELKTMKTVRASRLRGETEDGNAVRYLWPLSDADEAEFRNYEGTLTAAARSITHLGWGVDMVAGNAEIVAEADIAGLPGERWTPGTSGTSLRVPMPGTLDALVKKHEAFLQRLDDQHGFKPVPPVSAFRLVAYRRDTDRDAPAFTSFSLLKTDGSSFRAFNTVRHTCTVAGMMRHRAAEAARMGGWSTEDRATMVLGHGEAENQPHQPVGQRRFAFLPIPSIEWRGERKARVVGAIRRVIVTSFGEGLESKVAWARRALAGTELIAKGKEEPEAFLGSIPNSDKALQGYVRPATTWSSVTPVVLPGYDDPAHYRRRLKSITDATEKRRLLERLDARVDSLLRKAIVQAGFSETLARYAELEWRDVGFWPGVDLASRFEVPLHLKRLSRLHVQVTWRDAHGTAISVPGPICLGGGRYGGIGLFAAVPE